MKITLGQLNDSIQILNRLKDERVSSAKLGYRLGKLYRSAQAEFKEFVDVHMALLREYGTPHEGNESQWDIPEEKLAEFNKKWTELLSVEVEVWGNPFKVEEVEGQLELTPAEFAILEWLIIGDEPAEAPHLRAVSA